MRRMDDLVSKSAAKKKTAKPPARDVVQIVLDDTKTRSEQYAEMMLTGTVGDSLTTMMYSEMGCNAPGEDAPGMVDYTKAMQAQIAKVNAGDLSHIEGMLVSQAHGLSAISRELSRRAAMNIGNLEALDAYMRLALKAQSQCRSTLETLAEIKNPRQPVFAKQANIAQNQQVNNGVEQPTTRAEVQIPQNELRVIEHEPVDTGTKAGKARGHQQAEAVVAIDRAKDRRRQGQVKP